MSGLCFCERAQATLTGYRVTFCILTGYLEELKVQLGRKRSGQFTFASSGRPVNVYVDTFAPGCNGLFEEGTKNPQGLINVLVVADSEGSR